MIEIISGAKVKGLFNNQIYTGTNVTMTHELTCFLALGKAVLGAARGPPGLPRALGWSHPQTSVFLEVLSCRMQGWRQSQCLRLSVK